MEGNGLLSDRQRGLSGRFLLLVPKPALRPVRLIDAMRQRGVLLRVVHDVAAAMVEVAAFRPKVLVIHDPAQLERAGQLERLLAAVRAYHPQVICWRHEPCSAERAEHLAPFICELPKPSPPRMTPLSVEAVERGDVADADGAGPFAFRAVAAMPTGPHHGKVQAKPASIPGSDWRADHPPQGQADALPDVLPMPPMAKMSSLQGHGLPDELAPDAAEHGQGGVYIARNGARQRSTGMAREGLAAHQGGQAASHGRASLGRRLAASRPEAAEGLMAGPLLSAEEIDMLRGPIAPEGHA